MKRKITLLLASLLVITAVFAGGCAGQTGQQGSGSDSKTATVELEGNPTTGFTWIYTMIPEGIVKELSNDYIQDDADEGMTGVGGTFIFKFEAVAQGETELSFFYLREWEDEPAEEIVVYNAVVDANLNLTLKKLS